MEVVFFDAAYTLIRPFPGVGAIYSRTAQEHGVSVEAEALDRAFGVAWTRARQVAKGLPYGATDADARRFWRRVVSDAFQLAESSMPFDPFFDELFDRFGTKECWQVYPDVWETLERARESGVRVGVLSNFDSRLSGLLDSLDLARHFDLIVISCEVGAEKPDGRLFEEARRRAGSPAPESLALIGDQLDEDIAGARATGWKYAWLDRSGTKSDPMAIGHRDLHSALEAVLS